jgi:hypothetical protein
MVRGRLGAPPPPPRPPDMGASHSTPSTPNFCTDPGFEKYLAITDHSQPTRSYPTHKHLPKLDFPKFNGENPNVWAKKCEVYFDVLSRFVLGMRH